MRLVERRTEAERLPELGDRLLVPPFAGERRGQVEVSVRTVGTQAHRLGIVGGRLAGPPRTLERHGKIVVSLGERGPNAERGLEATDRLFQLTALGEQGPEVALGERVVGPDAHRLGIVRDGVVALAPAPRGRPPGCSGRGGCPRSRRARARTGWRCFASARSLDARQHPRGDEDGRRSERTGEPVHPKSTQHLRHPEVLRRRRVARWTERPAQRLATCRRRASRGRSRETT